MIWGEKAGINVIKYPCMDMLHFTESSGRYAKKKKKETFEQRPEARQSRDISLWGTSVPYWEKSLQST